MEQLQIKNGLKITGKLRVQPRYQSLFGGMLALKRAGLVSTFRTVPCSSSGENASRFLCSTYQSRLTIYKPTFENAMVLLITKITNFIASDSDGPIKLVCLGKKLVCSLTSQMKGSGSDSHHRTILPNFSKPRTKYI